MRTRRRNTIVASVQFQKIGASKALISSIAAAGGTGRVTYWIARVSGRIREGKGRTCRIALICET